MRTVGNQQDISSTVKTHQEFGGEIGFEKFSGLASLPPIIDEKIIKQINNVFFKNSQHTQYRPEGGETWRGSQ